MSEMPMKKFFIVGCPRSGTTMVQQALNRHSAIAIPPETKYFFSFLGHGKRHQLKHIERINKDLNIDLKLPEGGVRSDETGWAFFEEMANQYVNRLNKRGVCCFGEKTPEHTGHLSRIRQLFPDAKIIVLARDGRDVALSLSKTPWMCCGLYVGFVVWLYYQRLLMQARQSGFPNLHFVRYEDIVANPEKEFASILNFLELPYEPLVAEGSGNCEGIPPRELLWKANALNKISTDRVGSFRTELSRAQIAILERLGQRTLSTFGYQLLTDGKNRLSPGFLFGLTCGMATFIAQLPWYSLLNEIGDQMLFRLSV
jgi:hypothetical protein